VVGTDGEVTTEAKRKERECRDAVEWSACVTRLQAHLLTTGVLEVADITGFTEHTLKVMDLSTKKIWSACVEYDLLYRFAVHAGTIQWGARHDEAYKAAFLDKAEGARLSGGGAVSCGVCGSDQHATFGGDCPFRSQLLTGDDRGDGGSAKGGNNANNNHKYKRGDDRGNNRSVQRVVNNPTKVDGAAGDVKAGMWFLKIGGTNTCVGWNKGECNDGRKCDQGRVHACSFCKGPHRSTHCNILAKARK
jgi:hypothetical protein